ncbi:MAG: flavodoxin domain-containing protein [Lachnospiraceae bacterium]|nr:flavodoxin domain-containing protein [Lachnospiraceae bacterium]NCD03348.1 hypothetical protein [Clostridia bacterium]
MNTIVVYNSKTGFTRQYGEWIAEELGCKAIPEKEAKKDLSAYECIIYGGWLMAGKITGLDAMKANPDMSHKKLIVYATGATDHRATEVIEKVKVDNLTPEEQEKIPFFYMESGINFEKMGFFSKSMLKMMGKSLNKKQDKTPMEEAMAKMFEKSSDHTSKDYIQPLVDYVKDL